MSFRLLYLMHIVLALCRKVDTKMTEDHKLMHILKGIMHYVFNPLVFKDIDSQTDYYLVLTFRSKSQCIACLLNMAATSTCKNLHMATHPSSLELCGAKLKPQHVHI